MKKLSVLMALFLAVCAFSGCTNENIPENIGMPNPWSDCQDNLEQAAKIAGFKFPLLLSNYEVRAMKDMIEITYPLDETRYVTVRKSSTNYDNLSGDYNKYPDNKEIMLKGCIPVKIRADKDKIYIMDMAASGGYYSARCPQGMSLKEVEGIYEVIAAAEAEKLPSEAK